MSSPLNLIGIVFVVAGILFLAFELVHPGALLFIPGSILLVGGLLLMFVPDALLNSYFGTVLIVVAALGAGLVEIPYYRWVAPTHRPLSTTSAGLVGEEAIVIVPVVPNTLKGKIRVRSEIWSARSDRPIAAGTRVRVTHGEGVSVSVEPVEPPRAS